MEAQSHGPRVFPPLVRLFSCQRPNAGGYGHKHAPWHLVRSDDKRKARLNCISHLLSMIPYKKVPREEIKLPKRAEKHSYNDQASVKRHKFVPEKYSIKRGKQMRRLIVFGFILFLMSGSLLFAQDVRYNYDRKADFSKFKTFKWVEIKDADHANPLVEKQIRDTVEAELAKKGLQKTDSDSADLYVAYQTALGTEKQFTSYNTGWGYGPGGAADGMEVAWVQP